MKKMISLTVVAALLGGVATVAQASPDADLKKFRSYFLNRFDGVPLNEFQNGVYAIDAVSRETWEAIEEFPPYEPFIEEGEEMWNAKFANGKSYADCFADGPGQRKNFPHWDDAKKQVVTLPLAVNACRSANGEKPLKYKKGAMASLLAYMAYESRGQKTHVVVPNADAEKAYEKGKHFFYARRGQLNLSCANCHAQNAGMKLRTDVLSPALGHTTGWPVYRAKWGNLGTLHRRFAGCNKQVRAKWFKAQGEEYRDLEYFMTYMSNDIEYNGPSSRK